jgi:probable F420-dependent oxidoreductase
VTERIALGTAVYLLPLRHPTLIAKTTATVDLLSGGRLVLGVGVGGEFPPEFEAVGVPVAERGSRADEAIAVVRRHWSEERVAHEGRHFRFGAVNVAPKPARIPPIWVGGRAAPAMRRAGRFGDGYISHMCSAEQYAENLALIADAARQAGRADVAFTPAAFLFTFLEDRYEVAHEKASAMLGAIYARDFREASKKYCLLGRPEDCLEQLRAFAQAGARHFILVPLSEPGAFTERVAREMLPSIRALGGA